MDISQQTAITDAASILSKVQALLQKTTSNGCTEQEAASAAAKVQSLLASHNLNLAALENSQAPVYEKREKTESNVSALFLYQRKLMETIAVNNFCMSFLIENGRKRSYQLLGRKVNVTVTIETYRYLVAAMSRLNPFSGKDASRWNDGCSDRLVERLKERREQMERESQNAADAARADSGGSATGTELMVLSDVYGSEEELNIDALYGHEPGTSARKRREREARDAARQEEYRQYRIKEDELIATGMSMNDAYYVARGWTVPAKREEPELTEREKAKRDKEDAKWSERYRRQDARDQARRERERQREELRTTNYAYQSGRMDGERIGLDTQVNGTAKAAIN